MQIKFVGLEDFTVTCLFNLCLDTVATVFGKVLVLICTSILACVWGVGLVEDRSDALEALLHEVEPTL